MGTTLSAQKVSVSGTVTDPDGEPVAGAGIFVKEDGLTGTSSDTEGRFSIDVKPGQTLVFSFLGFDDFEYAVTGATQGLSVQFAQGRNTLDELVVVGYGVQKKSVMTSSVSRVTSEALDEGHPTDLQNALKGKVSGVTMVSESGQPGSGSSIRIRGVSTINDSSPLYIVDGMPSENGIDHLNPSDIESVEILKDAASAAIYGSRGANGVVLVTTKDGRKGKATLSYGFQYGLQNPAKKVSLANAEQYRLLINEMAANSGKEAYVTSTTCDTDWQEVLRNRNAPIVSHKVSLSGGGDSSNYYLSFGYLSQEGIYAKGHSDYERSNFRAKYNATVMDEGGRDFLSRATVGLNVSYTRSLTKGPSIGNSEGGGLIASMNMLPPTEPVYQEDAATLAQYAVSFPNAVVAPDGRVYNIIDMREVCNPLADMQVNHNYRYVPQNVTGSVTGTLTILPSLTLKSSYGIDLMLSSTRGVVPVYELNTTNVNATSKVEDDKWEAFSWQWDGTLQYSRSFGTHSLSALAGASMSAYSSSGIYATDYDLLTVDIDKAFIDTASASEELSVVSSNGYDHNMASAFARLSYNYAEKWLLEAVVRRDGSSNFAEGNRWGTFPSVSAGWVFTREGFMAAAPSWMGFGKLRLSWGRNGNERVGSFKYTTMMSSGHNAVIGGKSYTGYYPSGYSNADLKWETSEQLDLGLDLRFLENALTFTADWFAKKTKDMLLDKPIPLYTSFSSMTVNAGSVRNSGIEFEAGYRFRTSQVNWNVSANASHVRNEVTDMGPDMVGLNSLGGGLGGQISFAQNGHPYGFFYGYRTEGVFQTDEEAAAANQNVGGTPHAGDLRFADTNGDGSVDASDRVQIGDPNPDWTFGLNLTASWKNLDFSVFFQGVAGNDIYRFYRRPAPEGLHGTGTGLRGRGQGAEDQDYPLPQG